MTFAIVDSSVVVKWFVQEALSAEAVRFRDSGTILHAPDFLDVEVAAVLWKKIRRGTLTRADADDILIALPLIPVTLYPSVPLIDPAFDLADLTGRTVYDSLYLALAVQLGGTVVTADDRFANALAGTPWGPLVTKLQDVP